MGRSRLFSVTLVASLISISSTFGDPAVGNEANNKARGVLDMFGFGKPAQIDPNYAMGSPCYQPTTTTQAPLGPLCPLQPLDATESRPFENRPPMPLYGPFAPPYPWNPLQSPVQYPEMPQTSTPKLPEYPKPQYPSPPPVQVPPIQYPTVTTTTPTTPPLPPIESPQTPTMPDTSGVSAPNMPETPQAPAMPPIPNPGTGGSPSIIHGHFFPGDPPYLLPGQTGYFVPSHGEFVPADHPGGYQPDSSIPRPSLILPQRPNFIDPGFSVAPPNPLLQPTCAGIPVGPLIPPGFWIVNSLLRQQYYANQAYPMGSNLPLCNMVDVLQQLRLVTIFTLIQQAGLEQLFTQTCTQIRLFLYFNIQISWYNFESHFSPLANYTFFAPVDPAFEKLPAWFLQSLRDDIKLLRAFIMNHFIKIEVLLESLGNEFLIMNARSGGNRLRINVYNQESDYVSHLEAKSFSFSHNMMFKRIPLSSQRIYTVDGARMLIGDINTFNGILHVTDRVLVPTKVRLHSEYLAEVHDFSGKFKEVFTAAFSPLKFCTSCLPCLVFLSAVVDSGLLSFLEDKNSPVTLFLPYNEAFKGFDYTAIANDVQALQSKIKFEYFYSIQMCANFNLTKS